MKIFLIVFLFLLNMSLWAQSDTFNGKVYFESRDSIVKDAKPKAYCNANHIDFFKDNFHKPKSCRYREGKFTVLMVIEKDGKVSSFEVLDPTKADVNPKNGKKYGFVKEIVRVLDLLVAQATWTPAQKDDIPVRTKMQFYLDFRIQK